MTYLLSAPLYVQGGDTGELVTAAYHRLIAHPPGYPLYLWLQYFWTHLFAVGSIFWRASVFNVALGLFSLYTLTKPLKNKSVYFLIPILILGLKFEFYEASVLPDVFALHALFVILIGHFFFFSERPSSLQVNCFLLALSFTNHHTTVLLFPLYCYIVWDSVKNRRLKSAIIFLWRV